MDCQTLFAVIDEMNEKTEIFPGYIDKKIQKRTIKKPPYKRWFSF